MPPIYPWSLPLIQLVDTLYSLKSLTHAFTPNHYNYQGDHYQLFLFEWVHRLLFQIWRKLCQGSCINVCHQHFPEGDHQRKLYISRAANSTQIHNNFQFQDPILNSMLLHALWSEIFTHHTEISRSNPLSSSRFIFPCHSPSWIMNFGEKICRLKLYSSHSSQSNVHKGTGKATPTTTLPPLQLS